jgi:BirA family biotin operon repressor/biotin-[acetyl-CoA-carboxylase] ligase
MRAGPGALMIVSLDAQLLMALRGGGGAVSGVELSERLGITRAAIWARIEELRRLGYEIEASPHRGYRLIGAPDLLHADDLLARLGPTKVVGRDLRVFQETTSTSDVIEQLAQAGVKEGVVVFAEAQTKGRGRLGRTWVSPAGKGLWFSVLLRPALRPQEATQLTVVAATALARAVEAQTGLTPEIKWPNDLLLRGRKAAGILTELHADLDHIKSAILGVGLDVNQSAKEFPPELRQQATSLCVESGHSWDRAALAVAILRELDRDYDRLNRGEFAALAEEWAARCTTLGRNISIRRGGRCLEGRAESLDSDGALLLRTQHGHLERIIGGDLTTAL